MSAICLKPPAPPPPEAFPSFHHPLPPPPATINISTFEPVGAFETVNVPLEVNV
jgi:hypothetical protein